jgi:SAM-dependent methyltransferase
MTDKLFHLLQKPALYQRSTEPFWDDEHISKGMLEAHLNPNWDAASRKHAFIDRSAKWLSGIMPTNSHVLDLGCGPGLYTKRLSDMRYTVTGIDFSKRSIEYAKSQDSKTEYIYKNYLELDYTGVFDVVLLIYGDFAALTPDERRMLIPKVYKALKPGGLFVLDVFTDKKFAKSKSNKTSWKFCENGGFWSSEPHICLEATYLYENDTVAADHYIIITNDEMKEYLTWDTAYTLQKLTDEVSPFGFRVKSVHDDVSGSPYTGEGEELCIVLEGERNAHWI